MKSDSEMLKELYDIVLERLPRMDDRTARIEPMVREIFKFTKNLSDWLQKHKLSDDISSEREVSAFINNAALYINNSITETDVLVEQERSYLKNLFGESWKYLLPTTQKSLVSASVLWNLCCNTSDPDFDFSGICISVCVALEQECRRIFFADFQKYLLGKWCPSGNTIEDMDKTYQNWPDILLNHDRREYLTAKDEGKLLNLSPRSEEEFTLGSMQYFVGSRANYFMKKSLGSYLESVCSSKYADIAASALYKEMKLGSFAARIAAVNQNFRIPAAHKGALKKETAEKCCADIIGKCEAFQITSDVTGLLVMLFERLDCEKILSKDLGGGEGQHQVFTSNQIVNEPSKDIYSFANGPIRKSSAPLDHNYVERKQEETALRALLQNNKTVFLCGITGSGKSELARRVGEVYPYVFQIMLPARSQTNPPYWSVDDVFSQIEFERGSGADKQNTNALKDFFERIQQDALIILHDCNEYDELFIKDLENRTQNVRILATSTLDMNGKTEHPVYMLNCDSDKAELCRNIFKNNLGRHDLNDSEIENAGRIVKSIGFHPYITALLGQQCAEDDPSENGISLLADDLESNLSDALQVEFVQMHPVKDNHYISGNSPMEILKLLLLTKTLKIELCQREKQILSVVYYYFNDEHKITGDDLCLLLGDLPSDRHCHEVKKGISRLSSKLILLEKDGYLIMHDMIAAALGEILEPDVDFAPKENQQYAIRFLLNNCIRYWEKLSSVLYGIYIFKKFVLESSTGYQHNIFLIFKLLDIIFDEGIDYQEINRIYSKELMFVDINGDVIQLRGNQFSLIRFTSDAEMWMVLCDNITEKQFIILDTGNQYIRGKNYFRQRVLLENNSISTNSEAAVFRICVVMDGNFNVPAKIDGVSITSILPLAFYRCIKLRKIDIPITVTTIGYRAFEQCRNLNKIEIPISVTAIGYRAFNKCKSLTNIEIPASVTSIGDGIFYDCENLIRIEILASITRIGNETCFCCKNLTKIKIPTSVTSLGDSAFFMCERLKEIKIPTFVTSIGNRTFQCCSNLMEIEIPASVTTIGDRAFSLCENITRINIPTSVTRLGYLTFADCKNLTKVTIPTSVTTIGDRAFADCYNLTEIEFQKPSSVLSIGNRAFYKCENLTKIEIPVSVSKIGEKAFYGCKNLVEIRYAGKAYHLGDLLFDTLINSDDLESWPPQMNC